MAIESECIVCRIRQALDVCVFTGVDDQTKQNVLKRVMELLIEEMDGKSNGDIGEMIQNEIRNYTNRADPYEEVKKESIRKAFSLYPQLQKIVARSEDPLKTAVELSIAGNVIDFGPSNSHDIELAVQQALTSEKRHFDFAAFKNQLEIAKTVLVLGDNAGETVFDKVLMEQMDKQIYYTVKSEPIINDAVKADAIASGIEAVAEIIENGSAAAGTSLPKCSGEFLDLFHSVDMVISKGQANFETLVNARRRIFFLFKVKCTLLARKHSLPLNEFVLLDNANLH